MSHLKDDEFDSLENQIDSIARYSENKEEVELYRNALIKADKNYLHDIVGQNAQAIEIIINK